MAALLDSLAANPWLPLVPLAALLATFLGVRATRRNGSISKKALALSQQQEARRGANLQLNYLSSRCLIGRSQRTYVFDVSIINASDAPNAIVRAELWLDYSVEGRPVTLKVAPAPTPKAGTPFPDHISLPLNMGARTAVAGSVLFSVADAAVAARFIDGFRLITWDSFQNQVTTNALMVHEQILPMEDEGA